MGREGKHASSFLLLQEALAADARNTPATYSSNVCSQVFVLQVSYVLRSGKGTTAY